MERRMRRKAYCAAAAIASALLFLSSCVTESLEELSRPYIQEGYRLSALDAAAVYEEGLENVESPSLYYNLAYSYLEAGDYDSAIQTAEKALEAFPEYLRFMYLRAYALRESHRYYSYGKALEDILAFDPGNEDIRTMLLEYYVAAGREEAAKETAMEMLLRNPGNTAALRLLREYSPFLSAIVPQEETQKEEERRLWTEPPVLFDILDVLDGRFSLPL